MIGRYGHSLIRAAGICLLLSSCGSEAWHHIYKPIPVAVWEKSDTLTYCLPEVPDSGLYDFYVDVRTTAAFPYTGLKVGALTCTDSFAAERRDTADLWVQTPSGIPSGEGITLICHETPLYRLFLCPGQRTTVRLYHVMRREDLPGVSDVGLKVVSVAKM